MSATLEPIPPGILSLADYEAAARQRLDEGAWAYFSAHAGDGLTRRANRAAWDRIGLVPRVLRAVREVRTDATLFGRPLPCPLLVAPMALQRLAHPDGEVGMALAAAAQGAGFVLSSQASTLLETVAAAVRRDDSGRGPLWFQLYFLSDRAATLELVQRAEAARYEALVLTVDAAVRTPRAAEQRAGFKLPAGVGMVNLPASEAASAGSLGALLARAPTWDDVAWLKARTRLPLLLKGVLHPQDAREAARLQVDGLIVSNHGGRTLDSAIATAQALPAMADAVAGALPLLVDGGVVRGTDALKALALGARAVLVGRPLIWALASAGAAGVAHGLRLLRDELAVALAQCGAARLADLDRSLLLADAPPLLGRDI
ncbi:alpha-hydroxy acid oxidase [Ramlibacter rhizophilus]|uniref:Alpha-hydroxy-acid oxidizing protein n=1 Tax=Ramlibacter rhizophilus TaxID=1781167 RepID=A0A4Z0BHJ1_9BURK|nr:alpha-hydroxy acid oxidase [Ramlibacter rhizophilus]TFY98806.1 alpha-hydroxy-acid oxidizing protein [Ramlibacter rhizophilus]